MEIIVIGLILLSILLLILLVKSVKKNNIKMEDSLSLNEKVDSLKKEIDLKDIELSKKNDEIIKKDKNISEIKILLSDKKKELEHTKNEVTEYNIRLEDKKREMKDLIKLEKDSKNIEKKVIILNKEIESLNDKMSLCKEEHNKKKYQLKVLESELSLYSDTKFFVDIGFFEEPKYLYETSERYKLEIKKIRDKQKNMIQKDIAINIPTEIAIIEDSTASKKALKGQARIMLKAFNIECDLLFASIKPSNFIQVMERIDKIATDIEKSSLALSCGFNLSYIKEKLEECQLQYQFKLKREEEIEEQRFIKEQIKEEQIAIREFEKALVYAKKEEKMYVDALSMVRKELEIADNDEKIKLEQKILLLEIKLKEALEQETRAKSMAEQTRRGHVYVISNIGSFGENIFKIGMTRRLNPIDRVKELGDASVPFIFDVHAMIYSEDAPKLEKELHKLFSNQRVNMVNKRKEFFNISLDEIKNAVEERHGTIEFTKIALAYDFRETQSIIKQIA